MMAKGRRCPTPPHHFGDYVADAWGDFWRVQQTRQTVYDFTIYLGRPREMTGPMGAEVIITPELAAHFEKFRRRPQLMGLPLGETAIKRIRRVLGHHRYQDAEVWWLERLHELHELTTADFAARYHVSAGAISQARQRYLEERRLRAQNWWQEPTMRDALLSQTPAAWIALRTGLAVQTVRKYRAVLRDKIMIDKDTDLRSIRLALGLSVEGLRRLLGGVNGETIYRWERGLQQPLPPVLVLLDVLRRSSQARAIVGLDALQARYPARKGGRPKRIKPAA